VALVAANKAIPNGRWLRIIPPTIIVYIVAYMDRMNIGFAIAGGMNESLRISMTISGLAAGIFFFGYMVLQIPGGHFAEHGSAKKFIAWTIIAWGGISTLTGFVQNEWQLLAMRFLLGVAEGGLWPAILVILGNWFPAKEVGRANAFFMSNLAVSAIITNPLSGWVIAHFNWRYVFVLEGLISVGLLFIWMPLISDHPEHAKWISAEEKEYLVTTLRQEKEAFQKKQTGQAPSSYKGLLANKDCWMMILIYFCYANGQYGFLLWLPTIIKNLTKMGMTNVGLLSAIPYLTGLLGLYVFAVFSDRSLNRRFHTAITQFGFGICFFLATQFPKHIWVSYALLVATGLFTKAVSSNFWTIPPLLFPPGIAGGARGIINAIGNLGGFLGPFMVGWIGTLFGMKVGIYALVFFLIAGGILTMFLPEVTAGRKKSLADSAAAGNLASVPSERR
jgi:sugar phosphate permease